MLVRKSRFFVCFLWFPERPDPQSARAGAVETQFSPFDLASKNVLFLRHVGAYSWYRWRRNPVQKTFKIELESKICERLCFLCPGSVFGKSFEQVLDRLFAPLGRYGHQKGEVFLSWRPWARKKYYLTMSGGHWRFKYTAFSRIGGPGPSRKR